MPVLTRLATIFAARRVSDMLGVRLEVMRVDKSLTADCERLEVNSKSKLSKEADLYLGVR